VHKWTAGRNKRKVTQNIAKNKPQVVNRLKSNRKPQERKQSERAIEDISKNILKV